ncbi:IQCM protein, partial [Nothoprocta ornata]|nr:IQCM protein [Nothoprocta ornata]
SQHLSVPYSKRSSTQTPMGAPSISEKNTSPYGVKSSGMTSSKKSFPQVSGLEEGLCKPPGSPFPVRFIPASPEKAVKGFKTYVYRSPQYNVEQEERISVTELFFKIDSVSRALETEKNANFPSLSRSFELPIAASRPCGLPQFKITYKDKVYQDWRGVIAPNRVKDSAQVRHINVKAREVCKMVKCHQNIFLPNLKINLHTVISSGRHLDLQNQKKVKKNEAHLKDCEAFHDSTMHPNSGKVLNAVICIQRYVRAWLEHRAFKRIKIKAASHGRSLPTVVRQYRKMMARLRCRAGVLNLSTPLRYFELEEWMDKKKFYEAMFDKRQFCEEMDRSDLPGFFKDCGYFIPTSGIQRVLQMVCPTSTAPLKSVQKDQAVEMAFTLFPPLGSHVKNIITVPPPWVYPIIQGKDVSKNSGKNFSFSEREVALSIRTCVCSTCISVQT